MTKEDALRMVMQNGLLARLVARINSNLLERAGEKLRNDPKVVKAMVRRNGSSIIYAGDIPRNNPEIIMEAVRQDGMFIVYAGEAPRNDPKVVMTAANQNGLILQYVGDALRNIPEIAMAAVSQNALAFRYVGEKARNIPEIVKAAVSQNGLVLQLVGDELRNNPEIVMAAVSQNGLALQYAGDEVRNNAEVVKMAIQGNPDAIYFVGKKYLFGEYYDRMEKAIQSSALALSSNYRESYANVFLRNMLYTVGIRQVERFLKSPEIDEQDIKSKQLEYDEMFKRYYEIRYEPNGELAMAMDFFDSLDLAKYKVNGKNVSFDVYKRLNLKLQELDLGKVSVKTKKQQLQFINDILADTFIDEQSKNLILQEFEAKILRSYFKIYS